MKMKIMIVVIELDCNFEILFVLVNDRILLRIFVQQILLIGCIRSEGTKKSRNEICLIFRVKSGTLGLVCTWDTDYMDFCSIFDL